MFLMNNRIVSCVQSTLLETLFVIGYGAKGLDLSKAAEIVFLYANNKSPIYGLRFFLLLMECMELWSKDVPRKFPSKKKSPFLEKYEILASCVPKHSGECYLWADLTKIEECDDIFFNNNKTEFLETARFRVKKTRESIANDQLHVSNLVQAPVIFAETKTAGDFKMKSADEFPSWKYEANGKTIDGSARKNSLNTNFQGTESRRSNYAYGQGQANQALNSTYTFREQQTRERPANSNLISLANRHQSQSTSAMVEAHTNNARAPTLSEYGLRNNQMTANPLNVNPANDEKENWPQNVINRSGQTPQSIETTIRTDSVQSRGLPNQKPNSNEAEVAEVKIGYFIADQKRPGLTKDDAKFLQLTSDIMSARKKLMQDIFRHIVVLQNIRNSKADLQNELVLNAQFIEQMLKSKSPQIEKERRRVVCELEFVDKVFGTFENGMDHAEVDFASFGQFRQSIIEIIRQVYEKVPDSYQKYFHEKVNVFRTQEEYKQFKNQIKKNVREMNPVPILSYKNVGALENTKDNKSVAAMSNITPFSKLATKREAFNQDFSKAQKGTRENLGTGQQFGRDNKENVIAENKKETEANSIMQAKRFSLLHNQITNKNNESRPIANDFSTGVPANKMRADSLTSFTSERQLSQPREQLQSRCEYAITTDEGQSRRVVSSQKELKDMIFNAKLSRNNSRLNESAGSVKISFENCMTRNEEAKLTRAFFQNSNSRLEISPLAVQSEENFGLSESLATKRKIERSQNLEMTESLVQKRKLADWHSQQNHQLSGHSLKGLASLTNIHNHPENESKENKSFSMRALLSPNRNVKNFKPQFPSSPNSGLSAPKRGNLSADFIKKENEYLRKKKQHLEKALESLRQDQIEPTIDNLNYEKALTNRGISSERYKLANVDPKFLIDEYKKKEEVYSQLKTKYDKIRDRFVKHCFNEYLFAEKEQSEAMNDITVISQNMELPQSTVSDSNSRSRSAHIPKTLSHFPFYEMCI